jgi:hypothetical protein
LAELLSEDTPTLVGIDHVFSFPSVIGLNPAIRDRVKSGHSEAAEDVIVLPCRRAALQGGERRGDVQAR